MIGKKNANRKQTKKSVRDWNAAVNNVVSITVAGD